MQKKFMVISLILLTLTLFVSCMNKNVKIQTVPDKTTIHLRDIPTEIIFKNNTYSVIPQNVKDVEKKIGTTSITNFDVYKIKNKDPEYSIAILVRDRDPRIYYGAEKKK